MAIPDFQTLMLPLLELAADGQEHLVRDSIDRLADQFGLSEAERRELLPSGQQPTFDNRVAWARTYLKKAGLLEAPRRGYFRLTQRGREVLASKPDQINIGFLSRYPEFVKFRTTRHPRTRVEDASSVSTGDATPEEAVEVAYQEIRTGLSAELLQVVKSCSPAFFERLVVDLLVKMGYGGTRKDAGQAIGASGDGGIDGIIKEDRLGLDIVYIQAKRWENPVGRPDLQKFAGALQGQRARKGVFITTSSFTRDALDFAQSIDSKIVLIDGDTLADLMIDYGVGVTPFAKYELKRIDGDYFVED